MLNLTHILEVDFLTVHIGVFFRITTAARETTGELIRELGNAVREGVFRFSLSFSSFFIQRRKG